MTENSARFAELLKRAVNRIHANEGMRKTIVRGRLGYAAGREGRIAIDFRSRDGGRIPIGLAALAARNSTNHSCHSIRISDRPSPSLVW